MTASLFFLVIIIFSAVIHEYSHAAMADYLGDSTAKNAGRLTLNPLAHLDFFGTILMPLFLLLISGGSFLFAYAKPVPFNPYNLKNRKYGPAYVAFAGPLANLLVALIFGLMIRFLFQGALAGVLSIVVYANLLLAVFNLIPFPPLDGSHLLMAFLPEKAIAVKLFLFAYGPFLLLMFIVFGFPLLRPIIFWLYQVITGSPLL